MGSQNGDKARFKESETDLQMTEAIRMRRWLENPALQGLKDAASIDKGYQSVKQEIKLPEIKKLHQNHLAHLYASILNDMGILNDKEGSLLMYNTNKLVIPKVCHKGILEMIQIAHLGQDRMIKSLT